jgi:large subunit ribosomal protein L15
MKLHNLISIKSKRSQRIGRGGKRGTTSGRGTKGQRSRAGRRIRPAERDLIMRLPKRRGFRNKVKSDKATVFNLGDLSAKLKSYAKAGAPLEIDLTLLKTAGLVGKNFKGEVKILGEGEIKFPIVLKGISISKSAQEKIHSLSSRA